MGSGFLISPDGLFVTAYHVMKYCLLDQSEVNRFFESVDCSIAQPSVRYKALNGDREFEIQILSHLTEQDSTAGKTVHSPDEIIKQRDFVIGKLKTEAGTRFSYWELPDFEQGIISLSNPRAEFELKPLLPPKRVFIAGYPRDRDLEIAFGYLNLKDENHRGYFAANYTLYARGYLEREGISPDTQWGMRVENHMSGGAVVDAARIAGRRNREWQQEHGGRSFHRKYNRKLFFPHWSAGCCAGYNLDPNRNTTLSEREPTRLVATRFKAAT